jgi:hypothetical protein
MASLSDYFAKNAYKPKYFLGDRVYGKFHSIPFIGTVGNDRVINFDGPEITIHLDLPMKHNGELKNFIIVKHKDIKQVLKEL